MEYMLWYMMIPGRIENTNVIVDLKNLGLTQLPLSALNDIYKVMSHHYIGRVFKFYVVNLSWVPNTISGAVKAILTDRQKQKLNILDDVKELQKSFALHMLEEDLGGTRPNLTEFFPFEMPAGPFTAGYKGGPMKNPIGGSHTLLAENMAARQGTLWDSKKSKQGNTALQYSPEAYKLFQRCGYAVPSNCPVPASTPEEDNSKEEDIAAEKSEKMAPRMSQRQMHGNLRDLDIKSCDFSLALGQTPTFSDEEGSPETVAQKTTTTTEQVSPLEPAKADVKPKTGPAFPDGLKGLKEVQGRDELVYADVKKEEDEAEQVLTGGWFWCSPCR